MSGSFCRKPPACNVPKPDHSYVLHPHNLSDGGHDFVAKDFTKQATLAPASRETVQHGEIELHGVDAADIVLTVSALGAYEVQCSHLIHQTMGLKGTIVVERHDILFGMRGMRIFHWL